MKVGFIGAGNMGSAMMASMKSQAELYVYDIAAAACEKAKLEFGAQITKDIQEVVAISDIVFVAIKPQFLDEILKQIKEAWSQEKILASIVAGKTLAFWQEILGEEAQIARIMPNTPAMVKEGMNTVCFSASLQDPEIIFDLLSSTGRVMQLRENVMDAAMGVAGCGPAFVYMFIEALADGCVKNGLPRQMAYKMVSQAVLGSAKMVLETGMHPGELKDMVCSPGGTTIEGLAALEECGFRGALIKACDANFQKNKLLK